MQIHISLTIVFETSMRISSVIHGLKTFLLFEKLNKLKKGEGLPECALILSTSGFNTQFLLLNTT